MNETFALMERLNQKGGGFLYEAEPEKHRRNPSMEAAELS
jgi:hypothetical protein